MTTVDIPIGTTVYVRWYGKVCQAVTIDRKGHCDWPPFADWIPVRMVIPDSDGKPIVEGASNICMYYKLHVYATAEEAQQAEDAFRQSVQLPPATTPADSSAGDAPARSTTSNPSERWQALQKFKEEHWDQEHNHLRVDALEEYYQLWRVAIAERYGVTIEYGVTVNEQLATLIAVDPGAPEGDKSAEYFVDTETGEIIECADVPQPLIEDTSQIAHTPIVSEERYQELKQQMKVKLTKKQLRSTGRIEYADSIQTSLVD